MSGPALLFREIHRLRRFAKDLQEHIDRGPRLLRIQKERVTTQETAQKDNLEAIKKLKVDMHQKDVSLKSTFGQIAKYVKQMDTAASNKEMEAFKHQIAAAEAVIRNLEDEILAVMTETDDRTAKVPELDKAVQVAREECARFEKTHGEKDADRKTQLAQALAQLKEVELGIPEDIRVQYLRIVSGLGADGLTPARGRFCLACSTEITAQNLQNLKMHQFVMCNACGRILYPPEDVHVPGN